MKTTIRWAIIPLCGVLTFAAHAAEGQHAHDAAASAQPNATQHDMKAHSMAELRATVQAARASNDAAKMRAALAEVEAHFAQMGQGMGGCMNMSDRGHEAKAPMGPAARARPSTDHQH